MGKNKNNNVYPFDVKKCPICNKPIKSRGWYCPTCVKRTKEISTYLMERYNLKYAVGKSMIARMAEMFPNESDIFEYIYENPNSIFVYFALGKEQRKQLRDSYKNKKNDNELLSIQKTPKYILNYFQDREDLLLIDLKGYANNPEIRCKCLRCNNSYNVGWNNLKNGFHRCESSLSKGEFLVMKYLEKRGVLFKTQNDTLLCINPKTGYRLPYDFELIVQKVIIEVQGEQHIKYTEYFHSTAEAFEYQKYKDEIKKRFAISKGYRFVELFYADFKNGRYIDVLEKLIDT